MAELNDLTDFMVKHVNYEIKTIYPLLDSSLEENGKIKIDSEIHKVLNLGLYPIDKLREYYYGQLEIEFS